MLLIIALGAILFLGGCDDNDTTAPEGETMVRVIHASYDAPAVDVWVDDDVVIENLAYGISSGYAEVDDGTNEIMVVPAGSTEPVVIDVELELMDMSDYTVLAVGALENIEPIFALDQRTAVSDMAKVRFIHASPDAPAVDLKYDASRAMPLFENAAYKSISDYAEVPATAYSFMVTPAGSDEVVVSYEPITVENGNVYTVVAHGTLDATDDYPFGVRVFVDNNSGNNYVDLVEGSASYMDITAMELNQMMTDDPELIVIDVSPIFDQGHIPGSVNYPVGNGALDNALMYLDPMADYAVYCHSDQASILGAQKLIEAGFENVYRLAGNFSAWENAGYAVEVGLANLLTVHASPDAPGVDLLIDMVPVNSTALEYPNNTGYLGVAPGMRNVKVNVSGTATTVIDVDLDLAAMSSYSVFAADEVANLSAMFVMDDLSDPAAGNAHLRFIHLSPDAPSVDITLSDGTVLFEDYEFMQYSDFTPFAAATYDLQVRLHGTETVVLELPGIELTDGTIYTVFAKGMVAGSGEQALGAEIIVNN
jgi:rhodanese-related sulfurtransferase